jgi:predicted small secreted protein
MKKKLREGLFVALVTAASATLAGCGNRIAGNTYWGAGNLVQIEFQSGGKARASIGPMTSDCTYTENGKTVELACEGVKEVLTVNDDGSLSGPPGGLMGRLTKKK